VYIPFIFAGSKKCQFGGGTWWLSLVMEIISNFHSDHFDCRGQFLIHAAVYGLNSRKQSTMDTSPSG